jgi:hypothetical protein
MFVQSGAKNSDSEKCTFILTALNYGNKRLEGCTIAFRVQFCRHERSTEAVNQGDQIRRIFAKKIGEKFGGFDSKHCRILQKLGS